MEDVLPPPLRGVSVGLTRRRPVPEGPGLSSAARAGRCLETAAGMLLPGGRLESEVKSRQVRSSDGKHALISAPSFTKKQTCFDLRCPYLFSSRFFHSKHFSPAVKNYFPEQIGRVCLASLSVFRYYHGNNHFPMSQDALVGHLSLCKLASKNLASSRPSKGNGGVLVEPLAVREPLQVLTGAFVTIGVNPAPFSLRFFRFFLPSQP